MSEAARDYLSLNQAFYYFFFILPFLEKTFEKCSRRDTDGCYPYLKSLELEWGVGNVQLLASSGIEVTGAAPLLPRSQPPTPSQQRDHS